MFENKVLEKKKIKIKRRTVFVGCYLVFKLFAVNGLATSTLRNVSFNLDRFKGVEDVRCHG